jgi:hypothetical protein
MNACIICLPLFLLRKFQVICAVSGQCLAGCSYMFVIAYSYSQEREVDHAYHHKNLHLQLWEIRETTGFNDSAYIGLKLSFWWWFSEPDPKCPPHQDLGYFSSTKLDDDRFEICHVQSRAE